MKYTTVLSALFYILAGVMLVPVALGIVDIWFFTVYGTTITGLQWEIEQIMGTLVMILCAVSFAAIGSFFQL